MLGKRRTWVREVGAKEGENFKEREYLCIYLFQDPGTLISLKKSSKQYGLSHTPCPLLVSSVLGNQEEKSEIITRSSPGDNTKGELVTLTVKPDGWEASECNHGHQVQHRGQSLSYDFTLVWPLAVFPIPLFPNWTHRED